MSQSTQAIIVIRRSNTFPLRDFLVSIDGQRVGHVKRGRPAEFAVTPGEHEVSVSMDWVRSRPIQVVAAPEVRSELVIEVRGMLHPEPMAKLFLPILVALGGALWLVRPKPGAGRFGAAPGWLVVLVLYFAFYGAYILITSRLFRDYWALFTLRPNKTD